MRDIDGSDAFELARTYLAEALPRRWKHVRGVAHSLERCRGIFDSSEFELLSSAAILHDIGYAPELIQTGFHALDGARFLARSNAPRRLVALVAHHSCAYKEAELRGLSADLAVWKDEQTALRDALWWADMTTTPDGERTTVHDRIEEIQKRYGPEDLITFFVRQAKSELVAAVERTEKLLLGSGR